MSYVDSFKDALRRTGEVPGMLAIYEKSHGGHFRFWHSGAGGLQTELCAVPIPDDYGAAFAVLDGLWSDARAAVASLIAERAAESAAQLSMFK